MESVTLLLISCFQGSFELLIPEIKNALGKDNLSQIYGLINDILPFLVLRHRDEIVKKILEETTLIEELLKYAETTKFSENELKSSCLSLLVEIWSLEP